MPQDHTPTAWFARLMAVNREAFASGHFEAAYHALMAALHVAQDVGDRARLEEVAKLAGEEAEGVDAVQPAHRLSSTTSREHGFESVFRLAARQASVRAHIPHTSGRAETEGADGERAE